MNIIDAAGITKSFGARSILSGATFTIDEIDRIGLIGRNGTGKSTLLSILAGIEEPDSGTVIRRRGSSTGYLSQEPDLDESATVAEEIEKGLSRIRSAMEEYRRIAEALSAPSGDVDRLIARQGELASWIEQHGGWNSDHRVSEIMSHLGIADGNAIVGTLSGGMKRRVALARILLSAPDLLLLDEPTNHLDADATEWLQQHLSGYKGAVVLITHDRYFLDEVTGRILELERGIITPFSGGYSAYVETKAEQLEQAQDQRSRLLNLLRVETAWMRRGAKARSTKQKARIDRFHALEEKTATSAEKDLRMSFQGGDTLGGIVVETERLSKAFGDKVLLKDFSLTLKRGERIGIIGPNGSGKTTLIRMLLGLEPPDAGSIRLGKKAQTVYFDQRREVPDPDATLYEFLGEGDYVETATGRRHKIGYLEDFLFEPSDRNRKLSTLSGGEKGRLILAKLMLEKANILILDEPTNDLDIPTLQLLDEAIGSFPGCVIIVTHDRFFLDKVATSILAFERSGKVIKYEGNYSLYRSLKEQEELAAAPAARPAEKKPAQEQKKKKGITYAERLELEQVEKDIEKWEPEKTRIEQMLADPSSYAGIAGGIQQLAADFAEVEQTLARLYERWEELELKKSA